MREGEDAEEPGRHEGKSAPCFQRQGNPGDKLIPATIPASFHFTNRHLDYKREYPMNFSEIQFWQLLLASLTVTLGVRACFSKLPEWFDKIALLTLGLFLLFSASGLTFVIFTFVAVISYIGLKKIVTSGAPRPERYLYILIPIQLLPLLFYKYSGFILYDVLNLDITESHKWLTGILGKEIPALKEIAIPIGISFYTFQKIAFVVDTLAFKSPIPRFLDYMNFAGFFPQIVAGPIERRNDLLPQMQNFRFKYCPKSIDEGVSWITLGLFFKCCLADNFSTLLRSASIDNAYLIWTTNLFFGLRIYYDFAGYSLVALGLARCLGVKLTLNFLSPYCSTSITEFWRRWHITLSQWFRDYLYIPLGGGRTKWWCFNLMLVFLVSGLWHGAGWGFLLWGACHGLFLIVNRLFGPAFRLPAFCAYAVTMIAVFWSWIFFYETRSDFLTAKLKTLLTPASYSLKNLYAALAQWNFSDTVVLLTLMTLAGATLVLEWISVARKEQPYALLRHPIALYAMIVLTIWLMPGKNNEFIYFAF